MDTGIANNSAANGPFTPAHTLIDTISALATVIDSLMELPTEPPSIYMAITGVIQPGGECSLSILRLYIHPTQEIHLIDAQVLDEECFSAPGKSGNTLRDILESFRIPKVFFDVRDHSHILFRRFSISLQFVLDLQLMELATCYNASRRFVKDWKTCIQKDAGFSAASESDTKP